MQDDELVGKGDLEMDERELSRHPQRRQVASRGVVVVRGVERQGESGLVERRTGSTLQSSAVRCVQQVAAKIKAKEVSQSPNDSDRRPGLTELA